MSQEEKKETVVPQVKHLLRCKASITPRELGAIFNTLFMVMPDDQKRLLEMMPGIEFIPIPAQDPQVKPDVVPEVDPVEHEDQ